MWAQEEARLLNHGFIGTEHILLGLIREGDGIGARALQSLGISLDAVREKVEETIGMSANPPTSPPPFTPGPKRSSSSRFVRHCSSITTTSAPSTCSSVWSGSMRAWRAPSW